MHARFLAASSLLLSLLAAAPVRAAEEMAFDLLKAVSSDPSPPAGVDALLRGAHGQTRAAIRMKKLIDWIHARHLPGRSPASQYSASGMER